MNPSLRSAARRAAWGLAGVAALGTTFTLGVVAGAGSTPEERPATGLLDKAADEIAADGLVRVPRDVLDAAAIKAMLAAADDQWGSWGRAPSRLRPASGTTAVSVSMVSPRVGRIVVPAMKQGSGRAVREAVRDLRKRDVTGIVLDLRGNPGGLLTEAVETASAFLDGGAVVTYTRREEAAQRVDALAKGNTTIPLVVLVDGSTASAAEVVAGALQDRGRAVVVGARTFGKGSVQEPHRLPDGSSLALTVARFTLPSGRSVEGIGIEPDILVFDPDAALNRAVEVLSGLQAEAR